MLYYSKEASESAIKDIQKCIAAISTVSGKELDYGIACSISKYLILLKEQVERELK